jgi:hypothetical protein
VNDVPPDDGLNAGRLEELYWALRWLAAEPEAAVTAFDGVVTGDEIALDLSQWYEVARDWGLLDGETAEAVRAIDEQFSVMSDGPAELWSDDAIRHAPEWAAQRERARVVLKRLGVPRTDNEIGTRSGAPVHIPALRLPRLPWRR